LPADNGQPESFATTVTEVSERVTVLVREEIELARAEITTKVSSIARGTAAVAAGAVFGVFALIFAMLSVAWVLNQLVYNNLWLGFVTVFGVLLVLTIGAFLFAWRKLRVGAPAPTMAVEEAKKIRETVASAPESEG